MEDGPGESGTVAFPLEQAEHLVARLALYAQGKLMRLHWKGLPVNGTAGAPGAAGPEDLAAEALLDCLEGRRRWHPGQEPDLLRFLKSVVDSKVNHLAESLENRRTRPFPEPGDCAGAAPPPAVIVADQECADRLRAAVVRMIEGDEVAIQLLECLDAGIEKPSEIAVLLEMDVAQVRNAQKRVRRRLEQVLREQRREAGHGRLSTVR